jgi:two-component system, NtrC family, nitrogen regulation response regulator GlnG
VEERFRAITETASAAIISADRTGAFVSWNAGATAIFGYEADEVLGTPLSRLIPARYQEAHTQAFARWAATGHAHLIGMTVEWAGVRKDGSEFPLDLSLSLWSTTQGCYVTGSIRDLTARKRLEEQTRQQELQLIQANKMTALGTLVSGVAHEINNPNQLVLMNARMLADAWHDTLGILDAYQRERGDFLLAGLLYEEMRETLPALVQDMHDGALRIERIAQVITLEDIRAVLPLLGEQDVAVVVLDLTMPYLSGQTLLEHLTTDYPDFPVIVMTATNDLETAVQCMQAGAIDYLVKPVETNRLVASVRRALEVRALRAEVLSLKERLLTDAPPHREAFTEIITQSKAMHAIFRYVEVIARSPQPVLITGETGTGKELIARAIHRLAGGHGEFVAVNVAGLDDTMFSDTLFGHTKGAFTGADRPRQSHARTVVATNYDVIERVTAGLFRKDLDYRLRAHHIQIPPLRARREDLPLLINHFLGKATQAPHKPLPTPPLELYCLLQTYTFRGNVRELEAMLFDAVARH